ncbi:outer membrane protein assembly factor BamA [Candidatus Pelagibacter bacterium]|nr:outer membrane protein assembly factor BamA [Candidatus Pelagibacter bacterium]
MSKFILFFFIFFIKITFVNAEIIKSISVSGNERITDETVIIFSKVNIGDDLLSNDLNETIKNLYATDFFKNVSVSISNNILNIKLVENSFVELVEINGVKNKDLKQALLDQLNITENKSYVEEKSREEILRLSNFLKYSGYYFSIVDLDLKQNDNNTVKLIYNITLNKKAVVKNINFSGNKIFKSKLLSNVIVTEENKFWKFLSKKKYLNERQIELDQRLLKNFYLNEGYYNVKISQTNANIIQDNNFNLTYNINAGKKFFFNNLNLSIPTDYNPDNFKFIQLLLDDMKDKPYSSNSINKLLNEIDNIAVTKQYEFINASFKENIVNENQIDIEFLINDSQKLYVDRINIVGNDITNETAIRNFLIVDEGDPLNEILNNKSLNNIKQSGLFSKVEYKVLDTDNDFKKDIEINVTEQPTGEVAAGAGYGTSGQTISFGIKENNFSGNATKLNTNLSITSKSIKGAFNIIIPNYNYSDKSLRLNLSRTSNDFLSTAGYENTITNFTLGTGFEYKQDLFFTPLIAFESEDLTTNNNASAALKKQDGNYNNIEFDYSFLYDKRDQSFRTTDGYYSRFNQILPLLSNDYSLFNVYDFKNYHKLSENMISHFSFHISAINSLEGGDVRVSDRIYLSSRKLRGFEPGKIGPKDNLDFIGGNYASSATISSTLPTTLPELESIDFNIFLDAGNVWGVDYDNSLDNSKIRSSAGLSIDWLTPIGPLNFVFAQPLTKDSTDVEQSFRFDIGTTF